MGNSYKNFCISGMLWCLVAMVFLLVLFFPLESGLNTMLFTMFPPTLDTFPYINIHIPEVYPSHWWESTKYCTGLVGEETAWEFEKRIFFEE
jgi:hypothetical protein